MPTTGEIGEKEKNLCTYMLTHISYTCVHRSINVFISICVCIRPMFGSKLVTETKHLCVCVCVCLGPGVCRRTYIDNV